MNNQQTPSKEERRPSFAPAWFSGCNLAILNRAPSARTFYNALGLGALLISCLGGFAMCVSVAYTLRVPPSHVWWIGVAWAAILAFAIERIMLQTTSSNRRWLVAVIALRVGFSLLLAIQIGEPLA